MAYSELLYYPAFDPPVGWLKANLLFARKIRTIVPRDVNPYFHPANQAIFELAPELFEKYEYDAGSVNLDANLPMLDAAFAGIHISMAANLEISVEIAPNASVKIPGYVFLHHSKFTSEVGSCLRKHNLCIPEIGEDMMEGPYLLTEEHAANLIVSLIADDLARRNGWASATQEPLEFSAVVMNDIVAANDTEVADVLASIIIRQEIPAKLEAFTAPRFLELRKRYEPLREAFQLAVEEICRLERLDGINDPKILQERDQKTAERFGTEVAKFRQQYWIQTVTQWSPFSIATLGRIVGLLPCMKFKIAGKAMEIGVSLYEKVRQAPWAPPRHSAQRLLAGLQTDILKEEVFKSLIIS